MANKSLLDGTAPTFNVNKPLLFAGSFSSDVDPDIKAHLVELDKLLGKRIFGVTATSIKSDLSKPLTPKRLSNDHPWADESLAAYAANKNEEKSRLVLSEYIDSESELSGLKFEFEKGLAEKGNSLDQNIRTILRYPAIKD